MNLISRIAADFGQVDYPICTDHPCLYDALDIAARDAVPSSYLEIGVKEGASLLTVLAASPSLTRVVLCDTWGGIDGGTSRGSHDHIDALLRRIGYRGDAIFLDGDSRTLIPALPRVPTFDLITVDGCHEANVATLDLSHAWPLLRPGGILVMDDIERAHLRRVWEEFVGRTRAERLYELSDNTNATAMARKRSDA